MEQQYMIDSNTVIDYLAGKIPENGMRLLNQIVNQTPNVSVITKIEVLGFDCDKASERLLTDFFNDSNIIGLNDEIVQATIDIRKQSKVKTPDAIIAATALITGLGIVTRNTRDFNSISGLELINPYDF